MARINITRLVILSRRKTDCNISLRLIVPCFSMVIDCIIIQEVFNEEIILRHTVQEEDTQSSTQVHILHGYGLQYNTRNKSVNEEIMLCFTV